jgi:chromosome segregation protein
VRLTQIKLSGFKSFVDPTHIQIPGKLVGVVGPNGCGKSNIIDATRWVLGESKASELRGESMQDVIFSGSTQRKPAGRASVELVFDNSLGRAGGQWGQYGEISVKRILTRDGQSSYYINNQPVRRRDVHDIFLGTGLGPRAYAIIGQGMISRIIEAKPDELRVFLEEAAGVSKYKERRRETENRLHDTRENLTRIEDILRELSASVEKLDAQALVAEKFQALRSEQDEKQKLLWMLRLRDAQTEQNRLQADIAQAQAVLEEQVAGLRHVEAQIEALRQTQYAANDGLNKAQAGLYEVNSEVAKLEAEIRYVMDSRQRLNQQVAALTGQAAHWTAQTEEAKAQIEQARIEAEQAEAQALEAEAIAAQSGERLPELETVVREGAAQVASLREAVLAVQQRIHIESAGQRQANTQVQQLSVRRERLQQEQRGLTRPETEKLALQQEQLELLQQQMDEARAVLEECSSILPEVQQARQEAQVKAQSEAQSLAQFEARLTALRQLQEEVQHRGKLEPWLQKHGLTQLARLWQRIHVEAGWETALESVLRERLAALEVGSLDLAQAFANDAPPAKLAFYSATHSAAPAATATSLRPLLSLVQFNDPHLRALLGEWLPVVFVADSLADALSKRQQLPTGGCFVVQAGHIVGRAAISFYAADDEQTGMLARQQEIENLEKQIKAQSLLNEEARSQLVRTESSLSQWTSQSEQARRKVEQLTRDLHQLQMEVLKLSQQQEQYDSRSSQLETELEEVLAQLEQYQADLEQAQQRFEELDLELAETQGVYEEQQIQQEAREQGLSQARTDWRERERHAQEAQFTSRQLRTRIEQLLRDIEVASAQTAQLTTQREAQQMELLQLDDETAQAGLQETLDKKLEAEAHLSRARDEYEAATAQLRSADESRMKAEHALEPARVKITELQLKEQAARLSAEQYEQQLAEVQADMPALTAYLNNPETPTPRASSLQGDLTRLQNEITSLGAVNLAALDELKAARERKDFLQAQQNDLMEAMTTLEGAIRKIDQETRALLKDTFDLVNRHFGTLFPQLFGGGEARLMMTGDEILDAGVQVMAQPPGKRNSTIHLLSGGEKALTATALVFAIFQLNPAPFCLLDEVDAPLDDANTERFCKMVKTMADQTQFLFISHNKIAMEMAEQLIGVTMQEQGVSRIVAVDVESAARMADSGNEQLAGVNV